MQVPHVVSFLVQIICNSGNNIQKCYLQMLHVPSSSLQYAGQSVACVCHVNKVLYTDSLVKTHLSLKHIFMWKKKSTVKCIITKKLHKSMVF